MLLDCEATGQHLVPAGMEHAQDSEQPAGNPATPPSWRFAIDRGGTFTDVVATTPDGRLVTDKLLSEDPGRYDDAASEAVRRLMERHGEGHIAELRIGTTVATNALLERKGDRVALAVTNGFADVLRIGTQARPEIFARHIVLPEHLPERVIEIAERVAVDGTVLVPLDEDRARADLRALREDGFDALAILLVHGWKHTAHERRLLQRTHGRVQRLARFKRIAQREHHRRPRSRPLGRIRRHL